MLDFTVNVVDSPKSDLILKELKKMIVELEDLKAKVTDLESAQTSAVNLLMLLKAKLDEVVQNATDLADLKAGVAGISAQLGTDAQALADAVVANTPAA